MAIVAKRRGSGASTGKTPVSRQGRVVLVAAILALAALLARRLAAPSPAPGPASSPSGGASSPGEPLASAPPARPFGGASSPSEPQSPSPTPRPVSAAPQAAPAPAPSPAPAGPPAQDAPAAAPAAEPPGGQPRRGREPVFDNQVENRLEAVSRQGFSSIMPLRVNLPQEEVIEILRRPVEIYDDDDEETVAAKERTAEMKREALEYIEAGGTFNQFLRDCQAEANEAREAVKDVQVEMRRILFEQGEEAARAYLDRQNPLLREQGLEEVRIGEGLLRALELRRAKEAAAQ